MEREGKPREGSFPLPSLLFLSVLPHHYPHIIWHMSVVISPVAN